MRRVIAVGMGAAAVAVLAAGCASATRASSPSTTPASAPPPASSSAATPSGGTGGATLQAHSSPDGQILVDGSGRTLYLFRADTGSTSTCTGACAAAWPPFTTTGTPNAMGLTQSLVGTTTRADHSTQVTYKGHPLYYFSGDGRPGDLNGQGVTAFGAAWYVVGPSGDAITGLSSAPGSAPMTSPSTSHGGYGY